MSENLLISVIIPTYNRANTILPSVNSVLNQTYKNLELIVVDDCSKDNTIEILSQISDPRLKVLKHEVNKGQNNARNTGIMAATGDLIAHHDSDDLWHLNKLEKQLEAFNKTGADIICCQTAVFDDTQGNKFLYNHPNLNLVSEGFISYQSLLKYNCTTTQTFFGKASVFKEIMFDPNQPRFTDWAMALEILKKYTMYFVPEVLVDVYQQADSITKNPQKGVAGMNMLFEKHKEAILSDPEITESFFKKKSTYTCRTGHEPVSEMEYIARAKPSLKNKLKLLLAKIHLYKFLFNIKN